jgi:arsenate reductase
MAVIVYGIANCDQVRKTLFWLRENGVEFRFHDFRVDGIERAMLERWCSHLPWNSLLNRRGLTWRSIDEAARAEVVDQTSAIDFMLAHPTVVKRPVVEVADRLLLGFSAERLAAALLPAETQGSGS